MNETPQTLLVHLLQSFSRKEELYTLCFQLNINYDDLPGETRRDKARELIAYCNRNGRLAELSQLLAQKRPFSRQPHEPETIRIPAGSFIMGDGTLPDAAPQHEVTLDSYYIGKYPVTNLEYGVFVRQTRHPVPNRVEWFLGQPRREFQHYPVVGVSWYDAVAYCQWLTGYAKRPYRLPTEAEWERAARGTNGRLFPWGNEWQDGVCQQGMGGRTAVYTHADHLSPDGCADMVGHIEQWTSTIWGSDHYQSNFPYPYRDDNHNEVSDTYSGIACVTSFVVVYLR